MHTFAAALRFVREAGLAGLHRIDPRTIVIVGHSAGGGIALMTASRDEGLAEALHEGHGAAWASWFAARMPARQRSEPNTA